MNLTLDTARLMVAAARQVGADEQFKPLTVVVLDASGHVVAAEREDGSSLKRFEIAFGKAYGALALGIGSRAIATRAHANPHFLIGVTQAVGGSLVSAPGGVLIRDGYGALLGAVGISGDTADRDEMAAVAAIEACGLVSQAGE